MHVQLQYGCVATDLTEPVVQVFLLGKSTLEIHPVTSVHAAVLCYYRSTLSAYDGLSLLQEICRVGAQSFMCQLRSSTNGHLTSFDRLVKSRLM